MVAGDVLDTPLPPLTWLRAFEAAARHRSFTHAASELHVTPSAVSQHVRSLEGFLGKELFIRGTRSLHLTEGGSNYLPIVRQAFEILAEGTRAFRPGDPGRSLIVQASPAFSTFWLAPRIRGLLTMHPWLHLNLTTPIWDPERSSSDADVEIRFLRANETMDGAVRLTRDRCYPVCRPGYADGTPDWRHEPLFDCTGMTQDWANWIASQGASLPAEQRIHYVSTFVVAFTAALGGAGLSMAHDTICSDLLHSGALIRPYEHDVEMSDAYFLMAPFRQDATPASRVFSEWILDEIATFEAGVFPGRVARREWSSVRGPIRGLEAVGEGRERGAESEGSDAALPRARGSS